MNNTSITDEQVQELRSLRDDGEKMKYLQKLASLGVRPRNRQNQTITMTQTQQQNVSISNASVITQVLQSWRNCSIIVCFFFRYYRFISQYCIDMIFQ